MLYTRNVYKVSFNTEPLPSPWREVEHDVFSQQVYLWKSILLWHWYLLYTRWRPLYIKYHVPLNYSSSMYSFKSWSLLKKAFFPFNFNSDFLLCKCIINDLNVKQGIINYNDKGNLRVCHKIYWLNSNIRRCVMMKFQKHYSICLYDCLNSSSPPVRWILYLLGSLIIVLTLKKRNNCILLTLSIDNLSKNNDIVCVTYRLNKK